MMRSLLFVLLVISLVGCGATTPDPALNGCPIESGAVEDYKRSELCRRWQSAEDDNTSGEYVDALAGYTTIIADVQSGEVYELVNERVNMIITEQSPETLTGMTCIRNQSYSYQTDFEQLAAAGILTSDDLIPLLYACGQVEAGRGGSDSAVIFYEQVLTSDMGANYADAIHEVRPALLMDAAKSMRERADDIEEGPATEREWVFDVNPLWDAIFFDESQSPVPLYIAIVTFADMFLEDYPDHADVETMRAWRDAALARLDEYAVDVSALDLTLESLFGNP